jgi:ribose 5-phosphate isomerase B
MVTRDEIRALVAEVVDATLEHPPEQPQAPAAVLVPDAPNDVIAIGSDHGGYPLKERLAFRLREQGYEVVDVGTHSADSVDYPDFAHSVATRVGSGECALGIVVDGAGIGSAMVANKVPGVRAAMCYDVSSATNSREHNHANVLTLGAGLIGETLAWQILQAWLATPWAEGRHARRVAKITEIERQEMGRR